MSDRYGPFCLADPVFYDEPAHAEEPAELFSVSRAAVPVGWLRGESGPWVSLLPEAVPMPEQGWKVHVSAALPVAEQVIEVTVGYCLEHTVAVKFLRSTVAVEVANTKYADRRSSGKLVTIYPADDAQLKQVLDDLSETLKGTVGPYILSDLRWGEGPLFVRYGSFVTRYCWDADGHRVPALRGPDGSLVPDVRGTVFELPSWAPLPDCLAELVAARNSETAEQAEDDFPFDITEALHFSNGGGVYRGTDRRDGRSVVLREARPHAGLDLAGRDAVTRVQRERDVLQALAGLDFVPEIYEYRQAWEHHYLIEEYIEGERLEDAFARRFPLALPQPTAADLHTYTLWVLDVLEQLQSMLGVLHERGIVFGDLTPYNVLIRPDGRCALVDFEVSFPVTHGQPPALGTVGFVCASARDGLAVDDFALAALRLYLFLPLNNLMDKDSTKARLATREIERLYPVPDGFGFHALAGLSRAAGGHLPHGPVESPPGGLNWPQDSSAEAGAWRPVMDSLAAGISACATPERHDRLFPGDIEQFTSPGAALGLAHGAAGVLHALHACGSRIDDDWVTWLLTALDRGDDVQPGLYDGLAGIAWALDSIGRPGDAAAVLDRLLAHGEVGSVDLHSGQAGIALALLHFARTTGREDLAARALMTGRRLAALATQTTTDDGLHAPSRPGLLRGRTGLAALFLQLYHHTGDTVWLDTAHTALLTELDRAVVQDGTLHLPDRPNNRSLPYLAAGGTGLGLLADAYLRLRPSPRLAAARDQADRACLPRWVAASGLFEGRAGLILYLAQRVRSSPDLRPMLDRHLHDLAWHTVHHGGHYAVPGRMLHRLSADQATGASGLLLALHHAILAPVAVPGITDLLSSR